MFSEGECSRGQESKTSTDGRKKTLSLLCWSEAPSEEELWPQTGSIVDNKTKTLILQKFPHFRTAQLLLINTSELKKRKPVIMKNTRWCFLIPETAGTDTAGETGIPGHAVLSETKGSITTPAHQYILLEIDRHGGRGNYVNCWNVCKNTRGRVVELNKLIQKQTRDNMSKHDPPHSTGKRGD